MPSAGSLPAHPASDLTNSFSDLQVALPLGLVLMFSSTQKAPHEMNIYWAYGKHQPNSEEGMGEQNQSFSPGIYSLGEVSVVTGVQWAVQEGYSEVILKLLVCWRRTRETCGNREAPRWCCGLRAVPSWKSGSQTLWSWDPFKLLKITEDPKELLWVISADVNCIRN